MFTEGLENIKTENFTSLRNFLVVEKTVCPPPKPNNAHNTVTIPHGDCGDFGRMLSTRTTSRVNTG